MSRIVFAGGGTAGHIEPALAVARLWRASHPESEVIFIGTRSGLETRLVPDAGFRLSFISKVHLARGFSVSLLILPFSLIRAIAQSIVVTRGADAVVGFGGYVSGPAYLAAVFTRTPIIIHEANARAGLANRMGALFTSHTAVAHPIQGGSLQHAMLAGLPLREDVISAYLIATENWPDARRAAKLKLGFDPERPLIFIFGGSQGSAVINAVIAQSLSSLLRSGIQILHGVGAQSHLPASSHGYQPHSYLIDMASAYLAADLVISRSGAVTCAEVNTLGRYALFIPLPIGNGEQTFNADNLLAQSRAEILTQDRFTSEWLLAHIQRLLAASASAPAAGSDIDISAAPKMVSLIEHAIGGGR